MTAKKIRVVDVAMDERPVVLRLPFRYGATTLTEAREAVVSVRIRADGREAVGHAAELMAPKWFDKSPELTNDDNVAQLRQALNLVCARYLASTESMTAFGLHALHDADHTIEAAALGLNGLVAGFGSALIDKAVISALCRIEECSFFELVQGNAIGLSCATAPDLGDFDLDRFLASLKPANNIIARHTIGAIDALTDEEIPEAERLNDGLPESLAGAISRYGLEAFKIKLTGRSEFDINRLRRIAEVLARETGSYIATLDGNEQFLDAHEFASFWDELVAQPDLRRLLDAVQFVEQPIARSVALERPIGQISDRVALEIDESDEAISAFPQAVALGYRGVSSKSCKGVYRSLLNRARVEMLNRTHEGAPFFMSAEDLSAQAGLAVQQDLALATLIGCATTERNGHHFGDGYSRLSSEAIESWRGAHAGLYQSNSPRLCLNIERGRIDLSSLFGRQAYGLPSASL